MESPRGRDDLRVVIGNLMGKKPNAMLETEGRLLLNIILSPKLDKNN